MKTFKDLVNEVAQPISQGEKNFKALHGSVEAVNKNMVPGITDQDHIFKGLPRREDPKTASYEDQSDSESQYDKTLTTTNESVEDIEEAYKDPDKHYAKQSKKMQDAINLHLRKGKNYWDSVRAAKVHVKEDVNLSEADKDPYKDFKDAMAKGDKKVKEKYKNWKPSFPVQDKSKVLRYSSDLKKEDVESVEEGTTGWMLKKDPKLAAAVKKNTDKHKEKVNVMAGKNPDGTWPKKSVKEGWVALGPASKPGEKPKGPFNKLGGLNSGSKVYGDMPKQKASGRMHKGATDIASMRKEEVSLDEKMLTPAEKAKREEIVKAMKRKGAAKDARTYAIATATAKRVAENYDMDYEGEMAKAELNAIADKAAVLADMLDNDTQLEAWLQSKITKAKYMIDSVHDYMMYSQPNVNPEPENQSTAMASNYGSFLNRMGEGVEQIDEISKKTLGSYVKKAADDLAFKAYDAGSASDRDKGKTNYSKAVQRLRGIKKASDKLTKEELELDEARRGRPRKDGSKPEGDEEGGREHIVMQLRKVVNLRGQKHVEFNDDSKHEVGVEHAKKALAKHDSMHRASDKQAYAERLAKSHASFKSAVNEAVDPTTMRSDRGDVKPMVKRDATGKLTVYKRQSPSKELKVDAKMNEALKGDQHKIDANKNGKVDAHDFKLLKHRKKMLESVKANMAQDSIDKIKKDPLASKEKITLPPTQGNKPVGGEEQVHTGKFSVAEETALNSLYESLSDKNRAKFEEKMQTEEGIEELLAFATEQGF